MSVSDPSSGLARAKLVGTETIAVFDCLTVAHVTPRKSIESIRSEFNQYASNKKVILKDDRRRRRKIRRQPKTRFEILGEEYGSLNVSYMNYHTISQSRLPAQTKEIVRQYGFCKLSDFCNLTIGMIGSDLKLGAIEGAQLVNWIQANGGFVADQLDILSPAQKWDQIKSGNAKLRNDPLYHQWRQQQNLPIPYPAHDTPLVFVNSQKTLRDMLKQSEPGSVRRKVIERTLANNVGAVESVTDLDVNFVLNYHLKN